MTTNLLLPDGSPYSRGESEIDIRLRELAPRDEVAALIMEAATSVERDLALEDVGWINLSGTTADVITSQARILNLKLSRLYSIKEPLAKQAIRLWTDYTFGTGMTWSVDEKNEATKKALDAFWDSKANQSVLSARGQRKSSDRLLIDGEVFFALFLAKEDSKIRLIDPLEIAEIITDPDDREDVRYYRRKWTDAQGISHETIYCSTTNIKDKAAKDAQGKSVTKTDDALIYHLTYNTTTQRGNPLLLPALDWIRYYRKFLSSRIAIMLALAKFAWRTKLKGGQAAVDATKAKTHDKEVAAGSWLLENMGADTTPIKTDTGAKNAYEDGRQIKLMIAAAVGIPEQYFGDISIGNLATAKTVELPMMKMFQSYQAVWADAYKDINDIVLEHNGIAEDKRYVDLDFPKIAPADIAQAAVALGQILQVIPQLGDSDDVKQIALMTLGVNDPAEVMAELTKEAESNPDAAIARELKHLREAILKKEKKE